MEGHQSVSRESEAQERATQQIHHDVVAIIPGKETLKTVS